MRFSAIKGGLMSLDGIKKTGHVESDSSFNKNSIFTILVVDSQLSFDGFLTEFFTSEGHFMIRARSLQEALDMTRQYQPDMMLIDRDSQGGKGLECLNELLMEQPAAAVIMMASSPSVSEVVEAMKQGAADYLQRPLDAKKLKAAINFQKALGGVKS